MRKITITDMTMRLSGKGFSLSFREKIELVKHLDKLGVDVIEVSPITSPKIDRLLIKSISSAVRDSAVAVSVGLNEENIAIAWGALEEAKHPRLQVTAPVSAVQMEYLACKKPAAMQETIETLISRCKALCPDVELIANDATRADPSFLQDAIRTAIRAGANVITLCDTAGMMLPDQITAFLNETYANVPELKDVTLGISSRNELSMADSCAIAAIRCGASEVKCAAVGEDVIKLETMAKVISARGTSFGVECGIRTTQMKRILDQIRWMCQTERKSTSPFDNGVQSAEDLCLTVHDDLSAVLKAVEKLGYDLSEEDGAKVFEAFGRIAARKETVGARELDAIVASAAMQVPPTYQLESYVTNSGNTISATAHIRLKKNGVIKEGISLGDGPIDAAFLAIEQIAGHHYELDDFQIQSVTEGREAMGEAVVKLRSNGKVFSGRGISTDIVGASVHAYISALNKITYEEAAN